VVGNTKPTHYQNSFSGMTSPHIAVNKIFSKGFSVYINCSRGYKAPASAYFFIPATGRLNTELKPEVGDQIEVGSKGVLFHDRLSYQLALYDAQFKNKMTVVAVPLNGTTTAYSYIANGGRQDDQGIEALLKYKAYQSGTGFFRSVYPFANFAYSHFRYRDYV
ncbi:TonB-dependent receptor, partial [Acinetobacter baumannii]